MLTYCRTGLNLVLNQVFKPRLLHVQTTPFHTCSPSYHVCVSVHVFVMNCSYIQKAGTVSLLFTQTQWFHRSVGLGPVCRSRDSTAARFLTNLMDAPVMTVICFHVFTCLGNWFKARCRELESCALSQFLFGFSSVSVWR